MDEKKNTAQEWLETATKGIRFGPDRLAVETELREHLADKTADMARIFHIEGEEAEREALKRMGDPEEIGRELAKLHKPWLGYLWIASKIACCILIPLALFYLSLLDHYGDNVQGGMGYKGARSLDPPTAVEPAQVRAGGYTFRIVQAQPGSFGLQLAVRGSSPRFWERIIIPASRVTVVMPNGTRVRQDTEGSSGGRLVALGDRWSVFYRDCQLIVEGVPNRVGDWITVELEYPTETIVLSAQIGEGER